MWVPKQRIHSSFAPITTEFAILSTNLTFTNLSRKQKIQRLARENGNLKSVTSCVTVSLLWVLKTNKQIGTLFRHGQDLAKLNSCVRRFSFKTDALQICVEDLSRMVKPHFHFQDQGPAQPFKPSSPKAGVLLHTDCHLWVIVLHLEGSKSWLEADRAEFRVSHKQSAQAPQGEGRAQSRVALTSTSSSVSH